VTKIEFLPSKDDDHFTRKKESPENLNHFGQSAYTKKKCNKNSILHQQITQCC